MDQLRVGVLQFGTVNWEMDVILRHQLDSEYGFAIKIVPLSSKSANSIALQGGAVDVIVSDWIWVNRQRAAGKDYTFFPYSLTVGGLYVRPDSAVQQLSDLKNLKLGVAGGPVDKSWLLLQAFGRKQGLDIATAVEPAFAAPPLLNQLMLKGDLPAVLNFWHYGARLEAAGMLPLVDVRSMLDGLEIREPVPMLGWVFSSEWAEKNRQLIVGLLKASYAAKRILHESEEEWETIAPLTKAKDSATLDNLKRGYREGIPYGLKKNGMKVASKVFEVLAREGGKKLVGEATLLQAGTFWQVLDSEELIKNDVARQ
ncbi:MAG: ABC transporter substrate-binding protein [Candidatus Thiodiazotropha sp. (ex Ctena orbiculata)]|uniref:ABC transporter substrate-binding protein n=1 Tax=Candidatus Thiodiazotropha taylori TaxID=2792791 RepID=A0A944QVQ5_9GAMM|nr:ABC transporter substrate-binding protein [Candidatus Thiodiazotropha taylori]PUB81807.1 MAG: ABC transporter substrate-binding protein [gamma proteobacterium symbiont of Ctena orbiculata]MBT2990260.1 ABC transporter substrate-binding protein [Candidatus Thiodiazotropha taylori]MBT2998188.1 ABC transporter substrate-binding protein [Candidatus Thiodiazotropha taylori]MBT3002486.1 ABC transporter substrate-binding protein [Candidatus Thiodiazotropha taylori]